EGIGQQRHRQLGKAADADRRSQQQRNAVVGQRPVKCGGERVEVDGGQVLDDGDELVPAQASGGAVTAAPGAQAVGGGDERGGCSVRRGRSNRRGCADRSAGHGGRRRAGG